MRLEVRGKKFKIDLVSNYVHETYAELVESSAEVSITQLEVSELLKKAGKAKTARALKPIKEKLLELKNEIKEKEKEIIEARGEIIRELIESNNFEYDSEWWEKRTDPEDLNEFMLCCLKKDRQPNSKSSVKKK